MSTKNFEDNFKPSKKDELLARLLHREGFETPKKDTIKPRPQTALPIMSSAQQRMWFLSQLEPDAVSYNVPTVARLTGILNLGALEQSLNEIVRRHEVLRTSFQMVDNQPLQLVQDTLHLELPVLTREGLNQTEQIVEIKKLATEEAQRPFNLAKGPLIRIILIRFSSTDHVIVLTMHHIISDGWSKGILINELTQLYKAFCLGQPSPLSELEIQYADFAYWQHQQLQGNKLQELLDYWKNQMAQAPLLELPTDRPRPTLQKHHGAHKSFNLDKVLWEKARSFAQKENVTSFMLLLAAFQVLLQRYSGQDDIVVGTDIANRNRAEIEGLIGFFVNQLALRIDLSGNPNFRQLLVRVRKTTLDAYAHEELPFEKLVESLRLERDPSRSPLYQVKLVVQNTPPVKLEMADLTMQPLELETSTAKYDLTLVVWETNSGLEGMVEYDTDLFEETTINRLLTHWQTLLGNLIANPDQPVALLEMLSPAERELLIYKWNNTKTNYPGNLSISKLFEMQVQATPEAIALIYQERSLTYNQLNQRANQLAHFLQTLGVGPDMPVGLCLERSPELIIVLLGILKAGGAYVPIDPTYPQERQLFMLNDSSLSILLTQTELADELPVSFTQVICLDSEWNYLIDPQSTENLSDVAILPDSLAYIMYTSGSTGIPKGVGVTHKNILRLVKETNFADLTNQEIFLQLAPVAFDASTFEIWGSLLNGARLVIFPEQLPSLNSLSQVIRQYQISVLWLTTGLFNEMVEEKVASLRQVRQLLTGGDAVSPAHIQKVLELSTETDQRLVNGYGPTENTTFSSYYRLTSTDHITATVPIGRPIANSQIYILDRNLQPVPVGVRGELYLGGDGLARGYWNRPELTAERFIPDPFSAVPGARLYKTGDLGRYLKDGNIDFLGRNDNQIKIRGFRVELGEIENLLNQHSAINQSVVIARDEPTGGKRLVAYIVLDNQEPPSTTELQNYIRSRLPAYMVPAVFVILDHLPLTPNGKINRSALPLPNNSHANSDLSYVAPSTPIEQVLADIWSQIIGVEKVGIHDNFFALGGDSIRAIQVCAKAEARNLHFTLQQLFQFQTIADLTAQVKIGEFFESTEQQLQPFELLTEEDRAKLPANLDDAYPVARLQAGMLFHSQYEESSTIYHDIISRQLRCPFDLPTLELVCQYLIKKHSILRTAFDFSSYSEPLQLVQRNVTIPLSVEDLRHYSTAEQIKLLDIWFKQELAKSFDWTSPPLLRLFVHRLNDETVQFSMSFHHAILDGWSIGVLLSDLFHQYFAILSGVTPDESTTSSINYRDFVALERAVSRSAQAQSYWKQKLDGANFIRLPRLHMLLTPPEEAPRTKQLGALVVDVPGNIFEGLKDFAHSTAVPLKSVLLAAHMRVLSLLSSQTDITSGLIFNGRPETGEGENITGLFLNTLPFRQQLKGGSWRNLASQTFANEIEILPYRRYPLAQLQGEHGGRQFSEIYFNFIHFHIYQGLLALPGFEVLDDNALTHEENNYTLVTNFVLSVSGSELKIIFDYHANELIPEQVATISQYYLAALKAMIKEPDAPYQHTNLLSSEEYTWLNSYNQTATKFNRNNTLHDLITAQCKRTPTAIAVTYLDSQITYSELDQRSNKLACQLQLLGVKPDTLVGICLERSLEMVIGLLAILKAGGAYVPLDPDYPADRLAFMLADSNIEVLLTQTHLKGKLPPHQAEIICLDSGWNELEEKEPALPLSLSNSDNLAYTIYTSGSTGQPKGVQISHLALVNFLLSVQKEPGLSNQDRLMAVTTLSFDIAGLELFLPLISGSQLIIASRELAMNGRELAKQLVEQQITVMQATPATWRMLIEEGWQGKSDLKILCGGEALSPDLARQLLTRCATLWNMYGPTETTIWSTFTKVTLDQGNLISIGIPLANTQVYLLDRFLMPVPVGVAGELYIGGHGLSRGYLNRPELTAEKFVPDPFNREPGTRLYRTGDLARYLPNGQLEFCGRLDYQVKVRGFRIELGEIEQLLLQHPLVRQCLVTAREGGVDHNQQLLAYLVSTEAGLADVAKTIGILRRFLKEKLPNYMLPAFFFLLESLPLLPNGKINRKALPLPEQSRPVLEENYTAPRNLKEQKLADIWAEVLHLEKVGIYDNFFTSGGDSLRSIQLVAKSRAQNLIISLPQLFRYQTIAELAQAVQEEILPVSAPYTSQPFEYISVVDRQKLPENIEDAYPLSMLQFGMLYHSVYETGSTAYHDIFSYHIAQPAPQPFNPTALTRALAVLARCHPVLRTSFALNGYSEPLQLVHRSVEIPLTISDLTHLGSEEQEEFVDQWIVSERTRKFQWNKPPLVRVYIHKRSSQTLQISLSFHHAILDGWSLASLLTQLFNLYLAALQDTGAAEPPPPVSTFRDFVIAERQTIEDEKYRQFWRQKLTNSTTTSLPRWRVSQASLLEGGVSVYPVSILPEISENLKNLSLKSGLPLKTLFLTSHLLVLRLLTGRSDIITGLVSNGRLEELDGERVLGLFLNTLPFRMQVPAKGDLLDLARQVFNSEQEILPFRRFPLVEMHRLVDRKVLFEVNFNFNHFHIYKNLPSPAGMELLAGKFYEETNFPLVANFNLDPFTHEFELHLSYNQTELSIIQIEMIAGYYKRALALAASEHYEITELISFEEYQRLIFSREYQPDLPLVDQPKAAFPMFHRLFEAQVQATPQAIAVKYQDHKLTYAELNKAVNQLTHYLLELGLTTDMPVALFMERRLEMLIGLLAIIKAGGAFLPIDPATPPDRLSWMLTDAKVALLISQENLNVKLPQFNGQIINLDTPFFRQLLSEKSSDNPQTVIFDTNLAYITYTSGSTGKPKGTMLTHEGLANYLSWACNAYPLESGRGAPVHSSIAFDLTITALFTPLLAGGCVSLVPEADGIEAFLEVLNSEDDFSLIKLTPAHLKLLSLNLAPERVARLSRALIIGGEELRAEQLKYWQDYAPDTRLINEYGPTETVVGCCTFEVPSSTSLVGSVSIGRPIKNTQLYILDEEFYPVPLGTTGELYIGGRGLARGYINRPDLTAEKFIPNPFTDKPGTRLYKTGDLARYLPDGNIEFLGRIDQQVKIRGYRVELGEIEAVLAQHPALQAVCILLKSTKNSPENKELVAYLEPKPGATPLVNEIQRYLRGILPDYMIPAKFIVLESLPLTINGKVNRQALMALEQAQVTLPEDYNPPHTQVEQLLAQMWADLLGYTRVGIDDNFFALGGHSLLATQVLVRLLDTFKITIPLRQLFETPTIRELAAYVHKTMLNDGRETAPLPLVRVFPRPEIIPLSFSQQRLWFIDQLEPSSTLYNIHNAVWLKGSLNLSAFEQAYNEIIRRHEILRTTFTSQPGIPAQVIVAAKYQPISVINLSQGFNTRAAREEEAQRLSILEQAKPFDLASGPLIRLTLLQFAADEHVALITTHHITSDGWSVGIFLKELTLLYQAYSQEKTITLPELVIQYADYAIWQREWLSGENLQYLSRYWETRLKGAPALRLPVAPPSPSPVLQTFQGADVSFQLSGALVARLKLLSQEAGVTLFMTLLAAFNTLLYRNTGQKDLVIGTDVANRTRLETEALIGFFVNILALRTDLSGEPTFRTLLARVREVVLEAYAHQEFPFEKLVEILRPERNLSNNPIVQALFVLQNTPLPSIDLGELVMTELKVVNPPSRFDLAVFMAETSEGLTGIWRYNTSLFERETVASLVEQFHTLLASIVSQPDATISSLEMRSEKEQQKQAMDKINQKESKLNKLLSIKPKAIRVSQDALVSSEFLESDQSLPLVFRASWDEVDLSFWAKNNQSLIEEKLLKHGAVLFRGFRVNSAAEFEGIAASLCSQLFGEYGDLPRTSEQGKIYNSTPYPSDQSILFHNESSHMHCWPLRQFFFAQKVAEQGGATPIVDGRKVYQALGKSTVERLIKKKLRYVRNFTDKLDVRWQDFFHTDNKSEVEEYCRKAGIEWQWKDDNSLRTSQVRSAIVKHPNTGELTFFNQIQLHHVAFLEPALRDSLLALFGEQNLPRNVYYGDGTPIEPEVLAEISETLQQNATSFPWQFSDVLMLDNMLVAHGRKPYVGERKILVAMGNMFNYSELEEI